MEQRTIKNSVNCVGLGVHTGAEVSLKMRPAPSDTGIIFIRSDLKENNQIKADFSLVSNTMLGTTLTNQSGVSIATIEHLMAALWGSKIDNVFIEVNGPEIPVMDGSSEPFMFMIESAGIEKLGKLRKYIEITL